MALFLACLSHPPGSNAISDGPNPVYRTTGPHVLNECKSGDDKFQEKAMLNKIIRVRLPRGEVRKVEVKVSIRIVVLLMSCLFYYCYISCGDLLLLTYESNFVG